MPRAPKRFSFSRLDNLADKDFAQMVKDSTSYTCVELKIGYPYHNGIVQKRIIERIKRMKLCTKHFHLRRPPKPIDDLKGRRRNQKVLKRRLDQAGREFVCEKCNCEKYSKFLHDGQVKWCWRNWPICLEIDHINGDSKDDSLENLRYLCVNCHFQVTELQAQNRRLIGPLTKRQEMNRTKNQKYTQSFNTFGFQADMKQDFFEKVDYTAKSSISRRLPWQLRKWLLQSGKEYICEICRCKDYDLSEGKWQWQGQTLDLQVDHIQPRRQNSDDRVENLRFVCPNCHSQTSTWRSKAKNKVANADAEGKEVFTTVDQNADICQV